MIAPLVLRVFCPRCHAEPGIVCQRFDVDRGVYVRAPFHGLRIILAKRASRRKATRR